MESYNNNLIARALRFEMLDPLPRYWFDSCPVKTFYANALAFFIPQAEKFFIQSIKVYLPEISDPCLNQAAKKFIQQEANHSREYTKYIQSIVLQHYPQLRSSYFSFPLTRFWALIGGKKFRLAMTCVGEHFTAVMANQLLNNPQFFDGVPPFIGKIWQWHCIEEIEHKAVAFDVFSYLKGSYFTKLTSFIVMSLFIFSAFFKIFWIMMKQDKLHKTALFYRNVFKFLWVTPGFFRLLIKPYFSFLAFRFHPWQEDNRHLIKQWETSLDGQKLIK